MDVIVRKETPDDFQQVARVIEMAFRRKNEAVTVDRLRHNANYRAHLSLVAEYRGNVIGHILFFPVKIRTNNAIMASLALAPLAISPEFQKMGIGTRLVQEGLRRARELGYTSVIVFGHPEYYAKFGFISARRWGITAPFNVPKDTLTAIELEKDALAHGAGMIEYPEEFLKI